MYGRVIRAKGFKKKINNNTVTLWAYILCLNEISMKSSENKTVQIKHNKKVHAGHYIKVEDAPSAVCKRCCESWLRKIL